MRWILPALAVAFLLAGCGGSHRSAGAAPPHGYVTHRGSGFAIAIPPGWSGSAVNAARGAVRTTLTPAGAGAGAPVQVFTDVEPRSPEGIDQAISDQNLAQTRTGALQDVHSSVSSIEVAGAKGAKLVTQTYRNAAGPVDAQTLYVLTKSGTMITVGAVRSHKAPAKALDLDGVIRSFRLT